MNKILEYCKSNGITLTKNQINTLTNKLGLNVKEVYSHYKMFYGYTFFVSDGENDFFYELHNGGYRLYYNSLSE